MANGFIIRSKDKLQEISIKLDQSHLVYLQMDASPEKLEQRRKVEGFVKDYLCLVPNENKYFLQETADILHRSAATLQDFSGYRAATAWSAISLYAANLLAQPWRKEYRTLRTYSGYYKHEVEANLVGAELMFEQMGYKHTGLGTLSLEGPIDPDKVTNVSRDAIVAFVECQILKQIWEAVSHYNTISWLEILQFRENHVGAAEQAIRALNHRFYEKYHQSRLKSNNFQDYNYSSSTNTDARSNEYGFSSSHIPCQSDYSRYIEDVHPRNNQYFHPIDPSYAHRCNNYVCPAAEDKYIGSMYNPYCTISSSCKTKVPTDRLIELDTPHHHRKSSNKISDLDEVDFHRRQSNGTNHVDYSTVEKKILKPNNPSSLRSYDTTWDFVYSNLESSGYTKDLGDREDILYKNESESRIPKHKQSRSNEYDRLEKRKSGRVDSNEIDCATTNGRHLNHDATFRKKSSSFDLSDSSRRHSSINNIPDNQFNSHTIKEKLSNSQSSEKIAKILGSLKDLDISDTKSDDFIREEEKWNCATCTYLNSPGKEICEMCGKSKNKGNEDKPLATGGKQCSKCTLVNEKNVIKCDACDTSLIDSSTYV